MRGYSKASRNVKASKPGDLFNAAKSGIKMFPGKATNGLRGSTGPLGRPFLKNKKKKNWIAGAIKKPGALHRQLGVKQGTKIPAKRLAAAAKKGGKLGARARLAEALKGLKHKRMNDHDSDDMKKKGMRCKRHKAMRCKHCK